MFTLISLGIATGIYVGSTVLLIRSKNKQFKQIQEIQAGHLKARDSIIDELNERVSHLVAVCGTYGADVLNSRQESRDWEAAYYALKQPRDARGWYVKKAA